MNTKEVRLIIKTSAIVSNNQEYPRSAFADSKKT